MLGINSLRPRQNGCHFADDIFKCIFLNENIWILIKISLKFVPKGPINNIPALVHIMAWRRPGDKPLFEPMMVWLLTHICVTRPQWVKESKQCDFRTSHHGYLLWPVHHYWIQMADWPAWPEELTDLEVLVQQLHEIILNLKSSQNRNFGSQTDMPNIQKYLSPIIKILVVRHSLDSFSDFRKLQNYDQVPGGVLPMWWVIHMCRGFDPLFSLWQDRARSFWGIFSHPPTPKRSFGVSKLPILTEFDLLGPKFHFWVQFSAASGTPPSFFGPSTPPGDQVHWCIYALPCLNELMTLASYQTE